MSAVHPAARTDVTRFACVLCPDWPVVSWGVPGSEPAAVFVANRVVACSPAARAEGVAIGQRRRDAQGRCPDLAVLDQDLDREARLFEPVAAALIDITSRVEISGPGLLGFPTRGPSKFFGGDQAMADLVVETLEPVLQGRGELFIGIADGVFAARLSAATAAQIGELDNGSEPIIIEPGESAAFLSGFGVDTLEMPELADVLVRLGLRTLGQFAELTPDDVIGRFGAEGRVAHRLAQGIDHYPPSLRKPAVDMAVTWWFDPPTERIDTCAFAAKALADELNRSLNDNGLACIRVAIEAETENGDEFSRLWRHEGTLSAAALAERARWQMDGWLHQARMGHTSAGRSPDAGVGSAIARLSLIPDEVVPATGRQLGFWGGRAERADDVSRAVARLQGILGAESVRVPEWRGGRGPAEQITLIPAAAVDLGEPREGTDPSHIAQPWPGQIPPPAPAEIGSDHGEVDLVAESGESIVVTARGELIGTPNWLVVGDTEIAIDRWAGPWPADERWWDPASHRRRARMQIVLADQTAHVVVTEQQRWTIEATY
ncbi:MAG: DNA polymerase Y family protein [Acidimicrobiales bacterium]|nr:DNA polymerase Y family protein [Acidimicrobiales bacterium]